MTTSRRVNSGSYPADIENIQGKTLVNFDVQEVTSENGEVSYSYKQLLLQKDAPQELIDKEIVKAKVKLAKAYLEKTDFYMTVDKYETLIPERQEELKIKRAEARVTINKLEG